MFLLSFYLLFGLGLIIATFILWRQSQKYYVMSKKIPMVFMVVTGIIITLYVFSGFLIF